MHGLSSISASWSRFKLKTNTKPMGDHSHINNDTHRLPHIWPYIFTPPPPYISPKPLFLQVLFLSHCPEFWKFFTQRQIGWNLRKRYPNAAYFFMAFVTERPPIFLPCIHMFVWGECCSLKHRQKLENFVFSKQNQAIWWILSGANLIKVMKIKFQFYRLHRPNCALYGWMSLMIYRLLST